jgi:hypothetical protein
MARRRNTQNNFKPDAKGAGIVRAAAAAASADSSMTSFTSSPKLLILALLVAGAVIGVGAGICANSLAGQQQEPTVPAYLTGTPSKQSRAILTAYVPEYRYAGRCLLRAF